MIRVEDGMCGLKADATQKVSCTKVSLLVASAAAELSSAAAELSSMNTPRNCIHITSLLK